MSSGKLRRRRAFDSHAPSGTLSAPIDLDVDHHHPIQIQDSDSEEGEDSDIEVIEKPCVEGFDGTEEQRLEALIFRQNQVGIAQYAERANGRSNKHPNSQLDGASEAQTGASTVRQNQGRNVQLNGASKFKTKASTVRQSQGHNVQQNEGPSAQQVTCRRPVWEHQEAYRAVFRELTLIAERNAPIDRREGLNMSDGVDIFNHNNIKPREQPELTKLGIMVVLLRMLRQYEEILRVQPTEAEMALYNSFGPHFTSVVKLKPMHVLKNPGPINQPHVSFGLHVDPSGRADTIYTSTGISPNMALEMPRDATRVLVDKDYFLRLEKENERYRYHLQELEMKAVQRLENVLKDTLRGPQDMKPQKHKGLNSRDKEKESRKVQGVESSASALKAFKRKMLILKMPPKYFKQVQTQQISNAERKRGIEEEEAQATLVPVETMAPTGNLFGGVKADHHIGKRPHFGLEPWKSWRAS